MERKKVPLGVLVRGEVDSCSLCRTKYVFRVQNTALCILPRAPSVDFDLENHLLLHTRAVFLRNSVSNITTEPAFGTYKLTDVRNFWL